MTNDKQGGEKGGNILEQEMSLTERKAIVAKIARDNRYTRQFRVADRLNAIDLHNKMENLYKQQIELTKEVVHTFVFVLPDGTRFIPGLPNRATPAQLSEDAMTIENESEST